MTDTHRPTPAEIRAFRADNSTLRERDISARLGISEAALVAAETGLSVVRIDAHPNRLLERAAALGEVMVLTRNESAVHEKIGVFEAITINDKVSMTLGKAVDLRIFNAVWTYGFAVTKKTGDDEKLSLQYFDRHGEAVFKLHLRDASDRAVYHAIVNDLRIEDQSQDLIEEPAGESPDAAFAGNAIDREALRDRWSRITDPHEFFGMLKALKIERRAAVRSVGEDYAWQLSDNGVSDMLHAAAAHGLDIMCFVANRGVVQIHTGPVSNIQTMGPWLNIMDPTFHLHLRQDHIAEAWAVRKPSKDGTITSLEAYDAAGNMIIQFFGKRKEGNAELESWRGIVENLPRASATVAA